MKRMLLVTLILMLVLAAVYIAGRERNKKKVLIFKALATLTADAAVLYYALSSGQREGWLFAVGISLYACADVALELKFVYGMLVFAAGHFTIIAGLLSMRRFHLLTLPVFVLIFGFGIWLFCRYLPRMRRLLPIALGYASILCLTGAMTVTMAAIEPTAENMIRMIGSICFICSDGIIAWNFLRHKRSQSSSVLLLSLYYLALYLFAAAFYIR